MNANVSRVSEVEYREETGMAMPVYQGIPTGDKLTVTAESTDGFITDNDSAGETNSISIGEVLALTR